jgi:hypothetical protein
LCALTRRRWTHFFFFIWRTIIESLNWKFMFCLWVNYRALSTRTQKCLSIQYLFYNKILYTNHENQTQWTDKNSTFLYSWKLVIRWRVSEKEFITTRLYEHNGTIKSPPKVLSIAMHAKMLAFYPHRKKVDTRRHCIDSGDNRLAGLWRLQLIGKLCSILLFILHIKLCSQSIDRSLGPR